MCIPRNDMPQVDTAHLPQLLAFMHRKGVKVETLQLPPEMLIVRQCMSEVRPATNPALVCKPLLVAQDFSILDGDHRWAMHMQRKSPTCPCYLIGLPFPAAVETILQFPEAYRFGDGPQPYRI